MLADMMGTPFLHGGRLTDGRGFMDCYGVVVEAYRRKGIDVPDPFRGVEAAWGRTESFEDVKQLLGDLSRWVKLDGPRPGCVVLFSRFKRVPDHVGIMLDTSRVLHALEKCGTVIQRVDRLPFDVVGFYDYGA